MSEPDATLLDPGSAFPDKEEDCFRDFDELLRRTVRALADDALVEEYRSDRNGNHSDRLSRVLNYFRRAPIRGKYGLLSAGPCRDYRIVRFSGSRDVPPSLVSDALYATEAEADVALFALRVADLRAS